MINLVLGLILAGFGIYNVSIYTGDLTIQFYAKYYGMILGGLVFSGIELFPLLSKLKFNWPQSVNKDIKVKELSAEIVITNEQEQDVSCMYWLTERLKDDKEALDLLRKINDKLFTLHHPVKAN